jgi:hypothetical protein
MAAIRSPPATLAGSDEKHVRLSFQPLIFNQPTVFFSHINQSTIFWATYFHSSEREDERNRTAFVVCVTVSLTCATFYALLCSRSTAHHVRIYMMGCHRGGPSFSNSFSSPSYVYTLLAWFFVSFSPLLLCRSLVGAKHNKKNLQIKAERGAPRCALLIN